MTTLTMQLPDEALAATRKDPTAFARELRTAAAALWYGEGRVSQEVAAEIAGMDRTDFLLALAQMGRASYVVDEEDLDRELRRG